MRLFQNFRKYLTKKKEKIYLIKIKIVNKINDIFPINFVATVYKISLIVCIL